MTTISTEPDLVSAAELPAGGQALVQRLLGTPPALGLPDELYLKAERGVARPHRSGLRLEPYATVSTNTYFGRVPASYWQRWTPVDRMVFEADYSGEGTVTVLASDVQGEQRPVAATTVSGEGTLRLEAPVDRFVDGGALWVDLATTDGVLTVDNGRWTTPHHLRSRRTAVVVCTYNRAADCVTTLRTLAADAQALERVDVVYVVDQGNDRVADHPDFGAVAAELGDRLRYINQPNLGGAGGFTRGLYEVTGEDAEQTDVLFMDDDILLEPESIIRMSAFAGGTREPVIVGAQMLYALHPKLLHTGAEYADLGKLIAGKVAPGALWKTDLTEENQEVRVDAAYNAWWSAFLPAEVTAATGYPLPLFFQWDDIEYGYRAGEHGYPTVTLPGAGVWHADFTWKDWDDWSRYFSIRNSLITAALHSDFAVGSIVRTLGSHLVVYTLAMQYGLAATVIKAIEDFLAGPAGLADGGQEAAAAVRRLRKDYPETVMHPASAVPGLPLKGEPIDRSAPDPSMLKSVLAKRLLGQLLGRHAGAASVALEDSQWWHVSLFRKVVVTDASEQGVRVRQYDADLSRRLLREAAAVCLRLVREGPAVAHQYRQAVPSLTSRDNWRRLFTGASE